MFLSTASLLQSSSGRIMSMEDNKDSVDKIQLGWHELVYEKSYRPTLRNSHNVCHDSKHRNLYLFGGRSKGGCNNHLYHLNQQKLDSGWRAYESLKGDIPPPRKNSAMGYCASYLYLFGGNGHAKKGESLLNDFYAFNVSTESWLRLKTRGDVPSPRDRHSLTVIDGEIYIFGGSSSSASSKSGEEFLNDLYVHDPKTSTWTQIHFAPDSPRPEPRYEHCAAAMGNYLVISSGKCENGGLFDFWLFDTTQIEVHSKEKRNNPKESTMKWQRVEPKDLRQGDGKSMGIQAQPRWGQSVVAFHQKLIFFGGWNGKFCFNDVQVVDFGSSFVVIFRLYITPYLFCCEI